MWCWPQGVFNLRPFTAMRLAGLVTNYTRIDEYLAQIARLRQGNWPEESRAPELGVPIRRQSFCKLLPTARTTLDAMPVATRW